MAKRTVIAEEVFQIPSTRFTIGPSASGYTLNFAADPDDGFTAWSQATAANVNEPVVNANPADFYKLSGNTGEVVISY